ncbi:MAG: hypothetical protein CSA11_02575 [Chloroflexi bacterium]|nr:MAG: hypothetical protein CSA11_02575 [Chloroflexota bacterium]
MFAYFDESYLFKAYLVLLFSLFLNSCGQQQFTQATVEASDSNSYVKPTLSIDQESATESLSTSILPLPSQHAVQSPEKDSIVAFVSDRRERNNLDIWIIETETGRLEALTSDDSQDWNPLWSPDGEKLAYLSARSKEDIYVVVLDFQSRRVVGQLYKPDIWNISWSSDSNGLWLDTYSGIWRYDLLEENATELFDNSDGGLVAESHDGRFIAIGSQENEGSNAYSLQIQSTESDTVPIQFSENTLNLSVSGIAWANTTPRLVATFQTTTSHFTGRISVLDFTGIVFEEVATTSDEELALDYCRPAWSPLGDHLSYVVAWSYAEVPCLGNVYVVKDDLHQTVHISDNATITQQPWSPTGTQIVFSQNAKSPWWAPSRSFGFPGEGSIWLSNHDGGEKRMLTDGEWYDGEAVWRP